MVRSKTRARVIARFVCYAATTAAVVAGLGGCRPASDGTVDGPVEWTIDPTPITVIGEVDGDARYTFGRIGGVRLLPDGRIAVADRAGYTIRVYDGAGEYQAEMGRRGEGPGEFQYINGIWIAEPDTIIAYDFRSMRLSRFLASGELVAEQTFQAGDGLPEIYIGSLSDGTRVFAWLRAMPVDASVARTDSIRIGRFGGDRVEEVLAIATGMRRMGSPLPFSPHFLAARIGDTIFHTNGLDGRIDAIDRDGRLLRSISLELESWTAEAAYARLAAVLDSVRIRQLSDAMSRQDDEPIPTMSEILTGLDARLWVKQYDPATDSHLIARPLTGGAWLVIDTSGRIIARVDVPERFRLMDIGQDRVAGIRRDDLGVERVLLLRLSRG